MGSANTSNPLEFAPARWWRNRDRSGWHNFGIAMLVLSAALLVALFSAAVAQQGRIWLAGITTVLALGMAAWVAVAIVPALARRTSLRWLAQQVDYRLTRDGIIYLAAVFILILAAVNTGNNLLFLILACLLGGILISGVLSRAVLSGIELKFDMPEHIFAEQPVLAEIELRNEKQAWPSFSLLVVGQTKRSKTPAGILTRPVFFPYIPHMSAVAAESGAAVSAARRVSPGCFRHPHALPFRLLRENARGGIRHRDGRISARRADRAVL